MYANVSEKSVSNENNNLFLNAINDFSHLENDGDE